MSLCEQVALGVAAAETPTSRPAHSTRASSAIASEVIQREVPPHMSCEGSVAVQCGPASLDQRLVSGQCLVSIGVYLESVGIGQQHGVLPQALANS